MSAFGEMVYQAMIAIGEEEKATCIHCGEVWYLIHFRDGVCHQCQKIGRPGKSVMAARRRRTVIGMVTFTVLLILCAVLGM